MAISLKIRIRWGYIVAFMMLLISYFLVFYTIQKLRNETNWITHSYEIINHLHFIKGELTDAETGVRGYIITKDTRFLVPYYSGSKNVFPLFRELRRLTADNGTFTERINSLESLINRRVQNLSDAIESFQSNNFTVTPSMTVNRELNRSVMDSVRLLVGQLIKEEQILREKRIIKWEGFFTSTKIITIVSLIIALVTVGYSLITYSRENKAKEEADKYAEAYRQELENRVNELNTVNKELKELKSIEKFASTGRIARTIAHEVRNPLTNISLASDQLKEFINKNADAEVLMEMITRNAGRINQLVSDLLQSTRFAQLDYREANINEILDEALNMAADRIELNHIRIEKNYEANTDKIMVDPEKMKVAFLNIILNAIEAMEKGSGVLQVTTTRENNKCLIGFKDNGTGMDEETIQRVFEPYFTGKSKGNGLGLTNTQNIIFNHQGSIHVYSKQGQGATFIVTLNIKKDK